MPILASLFASTQILSLLAVGTPQQKIDLRPSFTRRSRSPPLPTPPPPATITMSTSEGAGYSGRLRSSTRPIREVQGEERERSRFRESRRGGQRDENLDDDSDTNTSHAQGTPTDRLDSPVHEEEAEKPLPSAVASRRQVSPASRERHKLTSSHSTEHHRRHLDSPHSTERLSQSFGDQGTHAGPSDPASEISRAQRALDDANATLHRREERRRHDEERRRCEDEALDQARAAAREASRAVERARLAIALSATSTAARATPPPARPLGVASQETRPGDDPFVSNSVQYMSTTPRVELSADLGEAGVAAATVLTSERRSSFRAECLSVGAVWARRDNNSAFGQIRRATTLALIKALRLAHDDAPDPVLWPTQNEALEGRRATKKRCGGSRDRGDRNRGGGISGGGGGQSGGNGVNGGGSGHHNRRGGGNVGGSTGGASSTGGGPERRQGSNQV